MTLMFSLFYSSVPVSLFSVTVSRHAQRLDPEDETAECYAAIIYFINYNRAFLTTTCELMVGS